MKRISQLAVFLFFAAFLLGVNCPVADAATRKVDVTVKTSSPDFFNGMYVFWFEGNAIYDVDLLKNVKVNVLVGNKKQATFELNNGKNSGTASFSTEEPGDIKIVLNFDWQANRGIKSKEYAYTGSGQVIVIDCADPPMIWKNRTLGPVLSM